MKDYLRKILDPRMNVKKVIKSLFEYARNCAIESLSLSPDELKKAIQSLAYARMLALTPLHSNQVTEDDLKRFLSRHNLSYYRYLDSLKIIEDALLLASSGRYLTGGAALRMALEMMIKGAFLIGLLDDSKRKSLVGNISNHRPCRNAKPFRNQIDFLLQDPVNRDGPTFEIALELALHDECKGEYRLPSFASMFDQIEKWGYFGPLSGSKHLIYESLYKDLCAYVHVSRGSTDYSQAIVSKSEYQAYCSGKVDDDKLKRFLPLFDMTLNTVGVVFSRL